MSRRTVWFNRGLSVNVHVIASVRAALQEGEQLRIVASHPIADHKVGTVADAFEVEPDGVTDEAYVSWCLDFARRHAVDVLIPGRRAGILSGARDRFRAQGTLVLSVATPDMLRIANNKAKLYEFVVASGIPIPEHQVVKDGASFLAACEAIAQRHRVCYKPTVDMAGQGFRTITAKGVQQFSQWDGKLMSTSIDEAVQSFTSRQTFPELLVMQYLDGHETSVDCLAQDGVLLRTVVRVKSHSGEDEMLIDSPKLVGHAATLARVLNLSGMFNVQFMDSGGEHYLLEINTRMSGGIHYGFGSGLCLPYWAIRLALGTATESDIPQPKTNQRVLRSTAQVTT